MEIFIGFYNSIVNSAQYLYPFISKLGFGAGSVISTDAVTVHHQLHGFVLYSTTSSISLKLAVVANISSKTFILAKVTIL